MSGRFLVILALAAGLGTAAVAHEATPIKFNRGVVGPSAGVIVQRGDRLWSGIIIRDAAARGARHDGVEIAAVADLEFGIDDHRHGGDLGRSGRDRFRVPQHRPRRDRFNAPKPRLGGQREIPARSRDRRLENRRLRGRRLHCDTAIGSSVLAFC